MGTTNQDQEHLRLLSIFHYVLSGMTALFALLPVIHLIFGLFFVLSAQDSHGQGSAPAAFVGWLFILIPLIMIATGWILAALMVVAGRALSTCQHYTFCLVIAGVECLFLPLGTVLGVLTIMVLMRDSVKLRFGVGEQSASAPPGSPEA